MYKIKEYSYKKADLLGVKIKPSNNKNKKIDVFKDGKKVASVGHIDYADYPSFIKTKGKEYADNRRKLYKKRHEKDRHKKNTPSYWADQILW